MNPGTKHPGTRPEDVVADPALTRERKIEILQHWAYDAAEGEVATEEGMPGGETTLLRRILLALEGLGASGDDAGAAPTKQNARPPRH
jgi:hypothetical protein